MSLVEEIESLFIDVAEKKDFALLENQLGKIKIADLTPALKKCLTDGSQLLFENSENPQTASLPAIIKLCKLGVAPVKLRDYLGKIARKTFSSYPDPAGLITALGCNNNAINPEKVATNWQIIAYLLAEYGDPKITGVKKGTKVSYCYTSKSGFGKIEEIDALSNQVVVNFKAKQTLRLDNFVDNSSLVLPDSLAANLIDGKKFDYKNVLASDLAVQLESCLVPEVKFSQALLTRIMMPTYIKAVKVFEIWYTKKTLTVENKTESGERYWGNARSLAEFNEHIPQAPINPNAEQLANLKKIFTFAADKEPQAQIYAEMLCTINDLCNDKAAMAEIISATAANAVVWSSQEQFIQISDKLTSKQLNSWFQITLKAKGKNWLIGNALELPNKTWQNLEKALEETNSIDDLIVAVNKQIKTGTINADILLWLWGKYGKKHDFLYPIMGNPSLILRCLGKEVKGSYVKALKDLRKLLMESTDFQQFLTDKGSENGVSTLVSAVRSMTSLDSGEKQSLLIKIVRLYPDKKHLVEDRKVKVVATVLEKVTSVHSYKERQEELKHILEVQIPQNRDAIATAAAHGDFRENFEFHAAKARKKLLESRVSELEKMLTEVKPTDFSEYQVKDKVIIGSVATVLTNGVTKDYTILGLWDSEPEKLYISYESPLGKVLLGQAVGGEIVLPNVGNGVVKEIKSLPADLVKKLSK